MRAGLYLFVRLLEAHWFPLANPGAMPIRSKAESPREAGARHQYGAGEKSDAGEDRELIAAAQTGEISPPPTQQLPLDQKFSTQGLSSISQAQALRGWRCSDR